MARTSYGPPLGFASERDLRRVARAVMITERRQRKRDLQSRRRRSQAWPPVLMRATAEIANGAAEDCNRVTVGDAPGYELTEDDTRHWSVLNVLFPAIPDDSYLIASNLERFWVATTVLVAATATRIRGQLTAACTGGTFSMDNIKGLDWPYDGDDPLADCANPYAFEGADNAVVSCEWNQEDEQWEAYQMKGIEITAVTDLQVSGTTIQKKTRAVYVPSGADESAWTTWHTGTECPE